MGQTQSVKIDNADVTSLSEAAIAELYAGAPEQFSDPGEETVPIEHQEVSAPVIDVPAGKVLLTNIRHVDEQVFLSDPATKRWNGVKAVFMDGRLVTDRETADRIKAICPYVFEEDSSAPQSQWFTHKLSGFRTTNHDAFQEYSQQWAENR